MHLDWIEGYTSFLSAGDEWENVPDVEPEVFNPDPLLSDDGGWGAPATPSARKEYTLAVGACATLGTPTSWSWLGALGLGVVFARRRRD
jgi:MYXO-CTERM domain-containing protein